MNQCAEFLTYPRSTQTQIHSTPSPDYYGTSVQNIAEGAHLFYKYLNRSSPSRITVLYFLNQIFHPH